MGTDKSVQPLQTAGRLEQLGQPGQGHRRREHPGGAAQALFLVAGMGGRVGAEEEPRVAGEHRLAQRFPVARGLGDGLAEQVGPQQAAGHVVQGDEQVVQGDGGREVVVALQQGDRLGAGDVLHDQPQAGEGLGQPPVNGEKLALPLHDETARFAVHQKRDVQFLEQGHGVADPVEVAHPGLAPGGDPGRVELDTDDRLACGEQLVAAVVPEKKRHVGREGQRAAGVQDGGAVGLHPGERVHRLHQVGHDHPAGELGRAERGDARQHGPLAQVEVHVQGGVEDEVHGRPGIRVWSNVCAAAGRR